MKKVDGDSGLAFGSVCNQGTEVWQAKLDAAVPYILTTDSTPDEEKRFLETLSQVQCLVILRKRVII